jgi:ADP-ribose pyrophosphatase YjhB (NUDIX family)
MCQVSHHLNRQGPGLVVPLTLLANFPPGRLDLYAEAMTRLSAWLRGRVHATAYPLYYRLPRWLRRWLVRRVAPTYTVGAVVLLRDETDRLLLLRQPPGTRGWSLPAGLLARGESPVEGAVRELAEETGIRLQPEQLHPASPNALVHHRGRWVDVVFEARVPSTNTPLRVDGAEVLEAAWYDVAALPPLTRATAYLLSQYGLAQLPTPAHGFGTGPA